VRTNLARIVGDKKRKPNEKMRGGGGGEQWRHTILLPSPLFCPSSITFICRKPKIETHPYNACLSLHIKEDLSAFDTKGRCALIMCDVYYPSET
jgi:hypothetical protein